MSKYLLMVIAMIKIAIGTITLADMHATDAISPPHPVKISREDITGKIYERQDMVETTSNGNTTLDVTTLLSSDKKFASGMYRSGKIRFEVNEPYGVDEFFFIIEGRITLTSKDGTVTDINAGEAVTIPKEWMGIWDTDGYSKIWVIYSEDGSGL